MKQLSTPIIYCICENCNKPFTKAQWKEPTRQQSYFCSPECREAKCQVKCINCDTTFFKDVNQQKHYPTNFCSKECFAEHHNTYEIMPCSQCGNPIRRCPKQSSKFSNSFCGVECRRKFYADSFKNNKRSRIEEWLEEKLILLYPQFIKDKDIFFNNRDILHGLELDIYIKTLKLGIEINGIFHYEQVTVTQNLTKIQNNDRRKFQICIEKGISLCIIDTSKHNFNKKGDNEKYLKIITDIIDENIQEKCV